MTFLQRCSSTALHPGSHTTRDSTHCCCAYSSSVISWHWGSAFFWIPPLQREYPGQQPGCPPLIYAAALLWLEKLSKNLFKKLIEVIFNRTSKDHHSVYLKKNKKLYLLYYLKKEENIINLAHQNALQPLWNKKVAWFFYKAMIWWEVEINIKFWD